MHPAKRRRADSAAFALAKPFRSPLAIAPSDTKSVTVKQDDTNIPELKPTVSPKPPGLTHTASSPSPPALSRTSPQRRLQHSLSSPIRHSQSRAIDRDAAYVALQKRHSSLLLELRSLSSSLDTATQALKIVLARKDDDLELLVTKWRTASRDAAEELFSTAKDRVNRMGGVGAWRDKYMKPREDEPWSNESEIDEDEFSEEQKEQREIAREEARLENEKYGLHQAQPLLNVNDDDSFTIDMMLGQLNVDLEVIGFDVQAQRWLD